jgi:hypothetical protein
LVIELPSHEILFVLCAFEICWDNLKMQTRGQLISQGAFSVHDGYPSIVLLETRDGWPSRGQLAYARADLRDQFDSTKVELKVKVGTSP